MRPSTRAVHRGLEKPVPLRRHDAADEFCRQPRVRGHLRAGRLSVAGRRHHRGRHPGVHPVCAQASPSPSTRSPTSRTCCSRRPPRPSACSPSSEEEEEPADPASPLPADLIQGEVDFAHVHFGYVPEKTVINDFSAIVHPGQKVAIVGPTGAGKTTMVKLLMRFYDVTGGAILLDQLRRAAVCPQRAARHVRHGAAGHLALPRHHP